mgnify:CR=1 FL=1
MTPITLKTYQQTALDALGAFARAARTKGPALAFGELAGRPYNLDAFGAQVPCVCLRIPTGGGKTVLAAHAVPLLAREWQGSDAPVAVWLVPSDAIRQQTLKALQTPGHAYRAALTDAYGEGLQVCTLDDVAQIAPPDWGRHAVVVVATIQSFRIEDAGQRNVYSFSESFEPHFKGAPEGSTACLQGLPDAVVTAHDAAQDATGVLAGFVGQPRWSLANWLALHRPLVIVDEAHNTKTDKSFTALQRLNPSFILELTATPIAAKTNVLYHVSAQELAAEDMIKLPIVLAEHPEGWPAAVFGAVQTQRKLEAEALKDEADGHGHVRPIVLFQAQNLGDEMPPEALRRYLVEELNLPDNQIVVATGTQRGLDDIDLAARTCPVRYVITVQALREGWDNPNVFQICTLNETKSAMKKRQEIGRGLRLCVNKDGERVQDKRVNVLTVIPNESYEAFAKALQQEIEDETGVSFSGRVKNARAKARIKLHLERNLAFTLDREHGTLLSFCMGFPASDFDECAPMVWGHGTTPDAAERAAAPNPATESADDEREVLAELGVDDEPARAPAQA